MFGYKTVWEVVHEARLTMPNNHFTDGLLSRWLTEAETDIQVNILMMVHEDVIPIVYAERWLYVAGRNGLAAGDYCFSIPAIAENGEEISESGYFTLESALDEDDRLIWDGKRLVMHAGESETVIPLQEGPPAEPEDESEEEPAVEAVEETEEKQWQDLLFRDDSRRLLVPEGWAELYVDWLLYKMYKAAREYRDGRNHENNWKKKRDDYCAYVADRWAPARQKKTY